MPCSDTSGALLTSIPVFLHRRFRHGFVFIRNGSNVKAPKDLIGKKVGLTNFEPAACVWMRGILEEDYGVPNKEITWVFEREDEVKVELSKEFRSEKAREGSLEDMLLRDQSSRH